ncbi:YihY/virulence factor BrkB family protein [Catalinimonas niigatensis]|uniref:YihY/virulence factor BrkB family protein n=1 Tax=Catalinimonas niigatensis TaxID=1397264 RepID=UPI0026650137|nr:YihY/virulence factor BrkB family protein [Catalinimonas niigatensis]WPP51048.1 YihY/virulence factor BrkB family protein [Catalinimonas niigatensis]
MSKFFKKVYLLIRQTIRAFQENDAVIYAAAIAFFTVFSLPSVLIIIVKVLGSFISQAQVQENLAMQMEELIDPARAGEILSIIEKSNLRESGTLLSIISIIFLLVSATVIFTIVQKALNSIWRVKPRSKISVRKFAKDRLLSFSMIILLGFLMLVSLLLEALLSIANDYLPFFFSDYTVYFLETGNYIISILLISIIFTLTFKFLPDAKIRWKDAGVGAVVTSILFTLGKLLISFMLSNTNITSAYGAAGSLAGILIWVFYSSLIVLIGAMFTNVYAANIGREIRPRKYSVRVETKEIELDE